MRSFGLAAAGGCPVVAIEVTADSSPDPAVLLCERKALEGETPLIEAVLCPARMRMPAC
jgi:hypothetical protein